ncbi:MAG: trypsin-like peptidase domain-containing protein [Clostridia bacterium]|nr:trypsin-like peptidase domain-containing protein [Clostridia bacterium]
MNVANKVLPSIVGIKVEYTANSIFLRNSTTASAEGSGIIISEDGYILTNNHIVNSTSNNSYYEIEKANKVSVYLYNDKTEYTATIVGTDEQTDLAVIKIDKTGLTPAELGDSDSVTVGEFSMAIGNPLGMQSSVTAGIISAVNRKVTDSDGKTYTLIQTDAAINSGNSGGALVNAEGKVIGINTLKLSGTGIEGMGFAIPINSTKEIYEQLIQYNKVKRPYIGITGLDLDEKTAEYNKLVVGIYVKNIDTFSAAEKAGVKIGDVIVAADGKEIKTMEELNDIKNSHKIGDQMTLKVNREGKEIDITLTLMEQP